jgi:tetratricopeptide (TPR) repeat protein
MIPRRFGPVAVLAFVCLVLSPLSAQEKPSVLPSAPDAKTVTAPATASADKYDKEGIVYEKIATVANYNADGTGDKTLEVVEHVQSDGGVRQAGLITLNYASDNEKITVDYVRVRKPDGTLVVTPPDSVQDMPTEVTRMAPLYSDMRQIQIPVKSLSSGDTIEYKIDYLMQKPLAPNEFWGAANFASSAVVLDESFELSYPSGMYVQILSPDHKPVETEKNGRTADTWHYSQLKPTADLKPPTPSPDDLPDISYTTFRNWQQVGEWYAGLAKGRDAVTPDIQAKVNDLLKNLNAGGGTVTDDDKIRAIYHFVSTQVRYIGVDFGIGRYQPHSADTVFENQYGDCKDKHTLLASMLKAAGYDAWPALIGTTGKLHTDLPTPSQFDHVITVVSLPHRFFWLDSTPEVTPYRFLMAAIRDKEALVVPTNGQPQLMRTPAHGPFPFIDIFTGTGKLDSNGTITGHLKFDLRGDNEVAFREVFHNLSRDQWQQAAQNMSNSMGFGGTISNLDVGLPEDTSKPFVFSYDYTRKNYADWDNRRIVPLTMALAIRDIGEDKPTTPIRLGSPRVEDHKSTIELPSDYTAVLPHSVSYTTDFAVYTADYSLDGEKFIAERKLQILKPELPIARADEYRKFTKHVEDDENQYIQLVASNAPVKPDTTPSNPEALELMQTAAADFTNHNYVDARSNLEQAEQLNPRQPGLWGEFAYLEMMSNNLDGAITDLRKEVQYHPESTQAWQQMTTIQVRLKRLDDAVQTLHDELKALPGNPDAEAQLGFLLILQKKYAEAATEYEAAVKQVPDNREMKIQAGRAELLAGKRDAATANLQQALKDTTDPGVLNDAAYEMADFNFDLPTAEASTKKSLETLDKETAQISLSNLSSDDLAHVNLLTAIWDTMGWVYFREGKLPLAESYLSAAWVTSQAAEVGGHLAQIYEKEGKYQEAADTDALALAAATLTPDPSGNDALTDLMKRLKARGYSPPAGSAGEKLGKLRTYSVPKGAGVEGSADFFVLLSPGKVEDVKFIHGDQPLRAAGDSIKKVDFTGQFPKDSTGKLVRRGILFCSPASTTCQFTLLLPQSVTLH